MAALPALEFLMLYDGGFKGHTGISIAVQGRAKIFNRAWLLCSRACAADMLLAARQGAPPGL